MPKRKDDMTCFLCDYWGLLLGLVVVFMVVVFTRNYWTPLVFPDDVSFQPRQSDAQPISTPVTAPTQLGTGDVQVTLRWEGANDLDLHVLDPAGEEIYYSHKTSASNGQLDVDANQGCGTRMDKPVENIFWPVQKAPTGKYQVSVTFFAGCNPSPTETPFTVDVLVDGKSQTFQGESKSVSETIQVYEFER